MLSLIFKIHINNQNMLTFEFQLLFYCFLVWVLTKRQLKTKAWLPTVLIEAESNILHFYKILFYILFSGCRWKLIMKFFSKASLKTEVGGFRKATLRTLCDTTGCQILFKGLNMNPNHQEDTFIYKLFANLVSGSQLNEIQISQT